MKAIKYVYHIFAERLRANLTKAQYVMFVASLTGLVAGLVAVLLKKLVHYMQMWIEEIPAPPAYLIFPILGLVLTRSYHQSFF